MRSSLSDQNIIEDLTLFTGNFLDSYLMYSQSSFIFFIFQIAKELVTLQQELGLVQAEVKGNFSTTQTAMEKVATTSGQVMQV